MARGLTVGMNTAVAAQTGTLFHLFKIEFSSGTVYLTTASHDVVWDGQTWQGIGGVLGFDVIEETGDEKGSSVNVFMSGVDQTIIALILADNTRGREVTIYEVHIDTDGTIIEDPQEYYNGFMNAGFEINEDRDPDQGGTVTIRMPVVSRMAELTMSRGFRTNIISHQGVYDGDTFFQHVPALADKIIIWGRAPAQRTGQSPPGGPGGPEGLGWH